MRSNIIFFTMYSIACIVGIALLRWFCIDEFIIGTALAHLYYLMIFFMKKQHRNEKVFIIHR